MLQCSHILCKVDRIGDAMRDFAALGFHVEWGSAPERAHNGFLWFETGPFIELFELPSRYRHLRWPLGIRYGRGAGDRLSHWATAPQGWCDVALEPIGSDAGIEDIRSRLVARGLVPTRIINGRRVRPDGAAVRYSFLTPGRTGLPFVVSHYDPPQRPDRIVHPNGATGVARVRMGLSKADWNCRAALVPSDDPWLDLHPAARGGVWEVIFSGNDGAAMRQMCCGASLTLNGMGGA